MAKKAKTTTDGKPTRGVKSIEDLKDDLGASGLQQVAEAQKKYSKQVLYAASRMFPTLPKKVETMLAKLSPNKAQEIRSALLEANSE